MHERGEPNRRGEPHREVLPERIGRRACDTKPEPAEEGEEGDDDEDADEAPFLADRAEQEVRIGVGQIAQLLLALPESRAEDAARAESHQRLVDLKAGIAASVT